MDSIEQLQKRANDAGVRFVLTEIEAAARLLAKTQKSSDPKERVRSLREARATVECASRFADAVWLNDGREAEIRHRLGVLKDHLDRLSIAYPEYSASRLRRAS